MGGLYVYLNIHFNPIEFVMLSPHPEANVYLNKQSLFLDMKLQTFLASIRLLFVARKKHFVQKI